MLIKRLLLARMTLCAVLMPGLFTSALAQSGGWEPVTGADTLRNFMSGLKTERTTPAGEVNRAEYNADGTGTLYTWGAQIARSWRVEGENQVCISVERKTQCFTFEKNSAKPGLYRARNAASGEIVEFSAIESRAVAKTEKPAGKEGGAAAPSAEEIAAQLANPNTPMASVTTKLQYRSFEGTLPNAGDQDGTTLLFQPSFPFSLSNGDVVFWRPALPIVFDQPVFNGATQNFEKESGVGDLAFDLAYGRTSKTGLLTAGGIISSLPIGSSGLTNDQFTLGPEVLIGKLTKRWVLGFFPNHQWGISNDSTAPNINLTTIQLFGTLIPGGGWTWGTAPIITHDHNNSEWTIPLNLNIGKTIIAGGRPWKLGAEINYYVDKPDAFGPKWMISISVAPVVENILQTMFKK